MNYELKDKELEDLWEWCGLKYEVKNGFEYWYDCNGNFMAYCLPGQVASIIPVTLDNLFKWAVPRVKADIPELKWAKLFVDWLQDILYDGKEPVTSLYERIQKVRSQ